MKRLVFSALLCVATFPAYAQHVEIRSLCHQLTPATSKGVEGAEYQGGRDVNGNPVASADLNKQVKPIVYPLEIPVEIDTLQFMGVVSEEGVDLDAVPAVVLVYEDGRVEYNGTDISDRASYVCDDEKPPEVVEQPANPVPANAPAAAPAPAAAAPAPEAEPAPAATPEEPKVQTPE